MTDLKLSHLVTSFLQEQPGSFKREQFLAWARTQGAELKQQKEFERVYELVLAEGYLTRDFVTFELVTEQFRNAELVVSLTPFELEQKILVPGHRFLPLFELSDAPWTVTLLKEDGEEIPKKIITAPLEMFVTYAQLLGAEKIPVYLGADQGKKSGLDEFEGPETRVKFTVYDLAAFLQETAYTRDDALLLIARDPVQKIFEIRKRAAVNRPGEKEIRSFIRKLDKAFEEVFETFGASIAMPLQIALALYRLRPVEFRKPPLSLGEYFQRTKKVEAVPTDGTWIFWSKKQPVAPAVPGKQGMLDEYLDRLGISLSEEEIEAYMRDEFFTGKEDLGRVKQRCFGGRELVFRSRKKQQEFEGLLNELWEEVKKDYNRTADKRLGPLRSKLLAIRDEETRVIRSIDRKGAHSKAVMGGIHELAVPATIVSDLLAVLNREHTLSAGEATQMMEGINKLGEEISALGKKAERLASASLKKKKAPQGSKRGRKAKPPVYIFKITLKGSKPPIWRRVQVPGNLTLADMHNVIQVAMGWENYHLHGFTVHGERYGIAEKASAQSGLPFFETEEEDEAAVTINELDLEPGSSFLYEYDYRDDWEHTIKVENVIPPAEAGTADFSRVVCLSGKRACPPEDCGGLWGFYRMLEALADPQDEEHDSWVEWIGEFDPEAFDIDQVNRLLARKFKRR